MIPFNVTFYSMLKSPYDMDHLFTCLVDFLFSSSPIDRRLSRDLVVVSHWEAGHKPSTSSKNNAPWRNKAPKNKSGKSLALLSKF